MAEPILDDSDASIFSIHSLIVKWGFHPEFFKAHSLRLDKSAIEKILIVEKEVAAWRKSIS